MLARRYLLELPFRSVATRFLWSLRPNYYKIVIFGKENFAVIFMFRLTLQLSRALRFSSGRRTLLAGILLSDRGRMNSKARPGKKIKNYLAYYYSFVMIGAPNPIHL